MPAHHSKIIIVALTVNVSEKAENFLSRHLNAHHSKIIIVALTATVTENADNFQTSRCLLTIPKVLKKLQKISNIFMLTIPKVTTPQTQARPR